MATPFFNAGREPHLFSLLSVYTYDLLEQFRVGRSCWRIARTLLPCLAGREALDDPGLIALPLFDLESFGQDVFERTAQQIVT